MNVLPAPWPHLYQIMRGHGPGEIVALVCNQKDEAPHTVRALAVLMANGPKLKQNVDVLRVAIVDLLSQTRLASDQSPELKKAWVDAQDALQLVCDHDEDILHVRYVEPDYPVHVWEGVCAECGQALIGTNQNSQEPDGMEWEADS